MAIITPVLVLLLFGIIDFGRAFNAYLVLNNIANEGTRTAGQIAELEASTFYNLHLVPPKKLDGKHCPDYGGGECYGHTVVQVRMFVLSTFFSMPVENLQMSSEYSRNGGFAEDAVRVRISGDYQGFLFGKLVPVRLSVESSGPYLY